MDDNSRHVVNLMSVKRCMPIKNRFIINIDSILYKLSTYLDVRSNTLD